MNKAKQLSLIGCASLCFLAGCAKQHHYAVTEQICVANLEKPKAMQIAEKVLGKMHFCIDKSDIKQGLIRTRPLQGAQFFEFWRKDNVGGFNFAEANLHTIRRTVELDVVKQGGKLCIGCNVKTQRLSLSERKVSSAHAYSMFSESSPSLQKLKLDSEQKAWIDLGQDRKLATVILKQIEKRIMARVPSPVSLRRTPNGGTSHEPRATDDEPRATRDERLRGVEG